MENRSRHNGQISRQRPKGHKLDKRTEKARRECLSCMDRVCANTAALVKVTEAVEIVLGQKLRELKAIASTDPSRRPRR